MKKLFPSALIIASLGCSSPFDYSGKIGEEDVHFYRSIDGSHTLEVKKTDGRKISYFDSSDADLKIEWIEIEKDGQKTKYFENEVGIPVLVEAQKSFDTYIEKIKEAKVKYGIESLK